MDVPHGKKQLQHYSAEYECECTVSPVGFLLTNVDYCYVYPEKHFPVVLVLKLVMFLKGAENISSYHLHP